MRRRLIVAATVYTLYLEARRRLLQHAERQNVRIGPRWLGLLAWRLLDAYSRLVGVRLASESGDGLHNLDPSRRYLIVWHPHGFIAWSALFVVSRMAVLGHPHGREWFAMVAPALFRIPVVSEALMLVNGRRVGKDIVENICERGGCIAIQPGGIREQMATRHDQEQAIFPPNLGFVRLAIRHGMDLLPIYIFNENQMFKRMEGFDKTTEMVYEGSGFGLPFITAKGGLPMAGLLPLKTDVHVRWGSPLSVGLPDPEPSDERVEAVFTAYLEALVRLFNQYAYECLPSEVAARGLRIVRLDGKPVPAAVAAAAATPRNFPCRGTKGVSDGSQGSAVPVPAVSQASRL